MGHGYEKAFGGSQSIDSYLRTGERDLGKSTLILKDLGINEKSTFAFEENPLSEPQEDSRYSPLDKIVMDEELLDQVVKYAGVHDLLDGVPLNHQGVILYGEAGTGKTVLLKAIAEIYESVGAYTAEISTSQLDDGYIGGIARNLEKKLQAALAEADERGVPSFLLFDEGSTIAMDAKNGSNKSSRHYQEALDTLKRYIGNDRRIVVGISSNEEPKVFDGPLTRSQRLTKINIPKPGFEQKVELWQLFVGQYTTLELTDYQGAELAKIDEAEQDGAFIEEFCRTYISNLETAALREKGFKTKLAARRAGVKLGANEVKKSFTFEQMRDDLVRAIERKRLREGNSDQGEKDSLYSKTNIGFR